jgi:hypothetical protein
MGDTASRLRRCAQFNQSPTAADLRATAVGDQTDARHIGESQRVRSSATRVAVRTEPCLARAARLFHPLEVPNSRNLRATAAVDVPDRESISSSRLLQGRNS